MTLHRFFLSPGAIEGNRVQFPDLIAHQIHRVLRMRVSEHVLVLDGTGRECLVRLTEIGPLVIGTIEEYRQNTAETLHSITLYQGLLKAAKFETVVQHCTEVGVGRIVPMLTARAVVAEPGAARQRRFEVIAREAAEQSGRGIIPTVNLPLTFAGAMEEATISGTSLLFYEEARETHLFQRTLEHCQGPISLFVGPEGGFTMEEVAHARASGVQVVSLGPRILRAETAAIVACALVSARFDMGRASRSS